MRCSSTNESVLPSLSIKPPRRSSISSLKTRRRLASSRAKTVEIVGVVAAHRGDDDRSGAQPLPDFGDGGIGRIGTRTQSLGRIEDGRRFLGCEAAEPAHQLGERARRDDDDASGLIAAQFAQREDERIEFGNALSGGRNQREQQALAVEFLEIESLLSGKPARRGAVCR